MVENIKEDTPASSHPGSTRPYVIGFILSLIFTIIPYLMVKEQIPMGKTLLLAVVLGFAVVQMLVQIFFFLHLGRGPKPLYNVAFFVGTAGAIIIVVGASIIIMDNLYRNMSPQEYTTRLAQDENIAEVSGHPTGACQGNNANHVVVISNRRVRPSQIDAKRCDTLTIKSGDGADYELAFGPHDAHTSYGGLDRVSVSGDQSGIITLNEVGNFSFHDHHDPVIAGHFTVKP